MSRGRTVAIAVAIAVAVAFPPVLAAPPALPAGTSEGTPDGAISTQPVDTETITVDTSPAPGGAPAGSMDPAGVAGTDSIGPAAGATSAATGAVAVTAVGVRAERGGDLVFALFRGEDGWPKVERAPARQVVPAAAESVAVVFAGVPCDTSYAVLVLHDRNGNGKLDMRVFPFPKPKEGAGVSHNHTRMGPPRYEAARFAVADTLQALRVVLRY